MTRDEYEILSGLLESFLDDSLITEVLEVVKGGKEATVFRCRAAPSTKETFLAAKVYRPMNRRNFRNDSVYQNGRVITNQRNRRAFEKRTDFGRQIQYGRWVNNEYQTQRVLFEAGVDVPRPFACNGSAILMEWLGDDATAAPQLRHASFASHEESLVIHRRLIENIRLMLSNNLVHGDLSPFNILYLGNSQVRIIDFPQAVDARSNRNACDLLFRDVDNVCRFFEKRGIPSNPGKIAADLWSRFVRAEL
jgi:RIO kinase 1